MPAPITMLNWNWLERIAIRAKVWALWRQFRESVPPEAFAVEVASSQGWTLSVVAQLMIEFEESQETEIPVEPLVYVPGGDSPATAVYQGDIVGELAGLDAHLLLVTRTGVGKSTLLKAALHRILQTRRGAEIFILDPKTTDWLGLQRLNGVVSYLPSGESEQEQLQSVELAEAQVLKAFRELARRKAEHQKALLAGKSLPTYHPVFLLIDEWFSLFDKLKRLRRLSIQNWLNEIISQGRELNVHAILVSQSHNVEEIGFSRSIRRNFEFCCLGAAAASFEPLAAAVSDANLFAARADRDRLAGELQLAIEAAGSRRVALTTLGVPRISVLPDLGWVHGVAVVGAGGGVAREIAGSEPLQLQPSGGGGCGQSGNPVPSAGGDGVTEQIDGYRPLYRAVSKLLQQGVSESTVIKEIFGYSNGRTFSSKGKPALQALLQMGKLEGWDK